MFALGGAGFISSDTLQKQKDFIKQFLNRYATSVPGIHVGILNYGYGEVLAQFNNYDVNDLKRSLDNMRSRLGGTVENALRGAQSQFFGNIRLLRPHATKALIVLTGDEVNEANTRLLSASTPLTNKGVKVVVVAVGRSRNKQKLEVFSSGEEFVFNFENTKELPSLVPQVYESILKGESKVFFLYVYSFISRTPTVLDLNGDDVCPLH